MPRNWNYINFTQVHKIKTLSTSIINDLDVDNESLNQIGDQKSTILDRSGGSTSNSNSS